MHFDTLATAQRLKRAGFTEAQVDALIDLAREVTPRELACNASLDGHLVATEASLNQRLVLTGASLKQRLTILEQRLTIRLGGLIVAAAAFIVTFLRLVPPFS